MGRYRRPDRQVVQDVPDADQLGCQCPRTVFELAAVALDVERLADALGFEDDPDHRRPHADNTGVEPVALTEFEATCGA